MAPNMWNSHLGYYHVPPQQPMIQYAPNGPWYNNPPSQTRKIWMPGCEPQRYTYELLKKKNGREKAAAAIAPWHYGQQTGPSPYPQPGPAYCKPNPACPTPKPSYYKPPKDAGPSLAAKYKPIRYSGPHIPLHILQKGTKVEDVDGMPAYIFRKIDFLQRSYQDNVSFKQFTKDFAGGGDWIITQVGEDGYGKYRKFWSIDTSSPKGNKTMADAGLTTHSGPVWLVLEPKVMKKEED